MNVLILLIATAGLVVFAVLYLNCRRALYLLKADAGSAQARQEAQQHYLQQLLDEKRNELGSLQQRLDELHTRFLELNTDHQRTLEQNRLLQQQLSEEKQRLVQVQQEMHLQFENTARQLLEGISGAFMERNRQKLDDVLKPLSDKIESFRSSVQQSLMAETAQRASLQTELQKLLQLNQTLTQEANNLTSALKADTRKQGNWGEMVLERVLEASGLKKGIHYLTQESERDEQGQLKRPDLLLLLPENRQLVIDSKVSLKAYEQYCSAATEPERQLALKAHLQSLRSHVDELGGKHYHTLYNNTTDFVLLFVPVEPAYALAISQQGDLYDYAFRKRIIMVSVPTLLATLRIIDAMWRLDSQNRNAEEIVKQGTALYEKFVGFTEDMRAVGQHLGRSQEAYESAMNKLSTGKGNLVNRAESMRRLGLNNKKELPPELIEKSET